MRCSYDTSTLMCLSGVAVRIARRIGLHRDGVSLGLPPFEVEMRRRLWWFITTVECRLAELGGSRPSQDLQCDTRRPLNINDSDLSPDMTETPIQRSGVTDMIFITTKCYIADSLSGVVPVLTFYTRAGPNLTVAAREEVIDKLQNTLEEKILRYCDPLQPLHVLSSILCRAIICKLKATVHDPFQYAEKGLSVPQSIRDSIFENGTKLIEYGNMLQTSSILHRYRSFMGSYFMWDSFIYTLVEIRNRKTGPQVDHVWSEVAQLFNNYPQVLKETTNPIFLAVGIWTVKVWEECIAARSMASYAEPQTPDFITQLRRNRNKSSSATPDCISNPPIEPGVFGGSVVGYERVDYLKQPADMMTENSDPNANLRSMQDILYFPSETLDWMQLDYLFREPK
jgi:Fungal specific transcription factor domain